VVENHHLYNSLIFILVSSSKMDRITTATATIESPALQHLHRAAIALNNYGIALLEKVCYREALFVLRDAMQTIMILSQPNTLILTIDVTKLMQNAVIHLSHAYMVGIRQDPCKQLQLVPITGDGATLLMRAHWGSSKDHLHNENGSYFVSPIRIDDLLHDVYSIHLDHAEVDAAIIIFNFALARWCYYSMTIAQWNESSFPVHDFYMIGSVTLHLLNISHNKLEKLMFAACVDDVCSIRTMACVDLIVLNAMIDFVAWVNESSSSMIHVDDFSFLGFNSGDLLPFWKDKCNFLRTMVLRACHHVVSSSYSRANAAAA